MRIFLLLFVCVILSAKSFSQVQQILILDSNLSEYSGANNLLTLHKGIYTFENQYLKTQLFDESGLKRKAFGITYRLGKTFLFDNVTDHMIGLMQHEIFGHGSRYRELGYKKSSYHLNLFPPYGDASGWASSGGDNKRKISTHESMLKVISGCESSNIMAEEIVFRWMARGSINYRESVLYLGVFNNLTNYIVQTKFSKNIKSSNDIASYLMYFPNAKYNVDYLYKQAFLTLLNPFNYFAAYSYLRTYLYKGQESTGLPGIKIKNGIYIPQIRFGLSPFGSEYYFDNYIKSGQKYMKVYFRYGDPLVNNSSGFGIRVNNLIKSRWFSVNSSFDIWDQPEFQVGGGAIKTVKAGINAAATTTLLFRMINVPNRFDVLIKLGYKGPGYLQGEKLEKAFIGAIGLSFSE